jgi:tetratricopeptide (TPR) repeat protein
VALLRELCRPLDHIPDRLLEHAPKLAGSPRALFELIRLLLESDAIVRYGRMSWKIHDEVLEKIELPETFDALIAARLAVMAESDRDLIEKAAVIGQTFWLDAVVALVRLDANNAEEGDDPDGPTLTQIAEAGDHTRVSVAQSLAKLVEREWLTEVAESSVPGEREYRFTYPNLWRVLYSEIDEDDRRDYHRMVAQWLELRPEGRGPLAQEDVGRHLELAGEANAAAQRYRRAADAARNQYFNDRAIRLYAQGLSCLGVTDHASRIHLWHDLGSVYELKGDFEAALGAFERMLRLAWLVASRTKAAVAFNKMGRVWRRKGDLKLALEYLKRGQELFEQAGDQRGIAGSYDDIGQTLYLLGLYDEAFDKVTRGLSARGRGGDQRSIAHSLSNLGNIQQDRGRLVEAENCHVEALELRRTIGDRPGVISSLNNLAVIAYERGDFDEAGKGWKQALEEAEDISALPLQALALANLGELALNENRHEEARSRIEDALDIAEDIDDKRLQVEATRNLALLENTLGNRKRARGLAVHAHEIASSAGLRDHEGRALLTLGEVHGGTLFDASTEDSGEVADAESYFRRGVDVLREIGNEAELARGLEQYGRYKIEQAAIAAGKDLLREALVIFSKLGMGRAAEVEKILASV